MKQLHILLVEERTNGLADYLKFLSCAGFRVSSIAGGLDVLERIIRLRPDLVLLSRCLPGIIGWEIAEQLKGDPRTRDIPLLLITTHPSLWAGRVPCDGVLHPPCSPGDLLGEILNLLRAVKSVSRVR